MGKVISSEIKEKLLDMIRNNNVDTVKVGETHFKFQEMLIENNFTSIERTMILSMMNESNLVMIIGEYIESIRED